MEEYFIAVFKSRTQTLKFYDVLRQNGVCAGIINTPRQVSLGCGLSVKFFTQNLSFVKRFLTLDNYYSYGGLFLASNEGNNLKIRPV